MATLWALLASVALVSFRSALSLDFKSQCLSFSPQHLYPNSTLNILQFVPSGTNLTFPDNVASCNRPSQIVNTDLCRIALLLPTSTKSSISFEAWLPRDWTGRFLATGNGGIDGCTKYEDIAYGALHGFATVGSNNGHNGTGGIGFYQNPEVLEDFAWRSLHTITSFGKRLTAAFYKQAHKKSYYLGCSLGGRQGIDAAERNPTDFDGIVAGSPAVNFNLLYAWRGSFFPKTGGPQSAGFISPAVWKGIIHDEVLRQCDAIDGARDQIIEDASLCHFDPTPLQCPSVQIALQENATTCLSAAQVETVRCIFEPLRNGQRILIPGMQPGSEIAAADGLYNGKPFPYSLDWFKYVVYDPSWNGSRMTTEDALTADKLNPFNIRTYPASLKSFASRGGKILTFHGQQDQQITSFNSVDFYHHLSKGMYGFFSPERLDSFYRFFRISGMGHCSSGPGAWVFGQGGNAATSGVPFDNQHNILAAIVDWVERDEAPEAMIGTKFVNDTVASGVDFQRRHCKYPKRNIFLGGNPKEMDRWTCV